MQDSGAYLQVHAWLLRNASRVFKDLLAVIEDKEIQLAETNYEVKLLLNALYGPSIVLPEGVDLPAGTPIARALGCSPGYHLGLAPCLICRPSAGGGGPILEDSVHVGRAC